MRGFMAAAPRVAASELDAGTLASSLGKHGDTPEAGIQPFVLG